jgi:hypothetical protein
MRTFDPNIYKSVSNKYRHIAKLPDKKSGSEALKEIDLSTYQNFLNQFEHNCESTFLRCYALKIKDLHETLTEEEYNYFRSHGGYST